MSVILLRKETSWKPNLFMRISLVFIESKDPSPKGSIPSRIMVQNSFALPVPPSTSDSSSNDIIKGDIIRGDVLAALVLLAASSGCIGGIVDEDIIEDRRKVSASNEMLIIMHIIIIIIIIISTVSTVVQ